MLGAAAAALRQSPSVLLCHHSWVHSGLSSPSVDTTRVALQDVDESVPGSDYINANYIKVLGKGKRPCGGCLQPSAVFVVGKGSDGVSLEGMPHQDQYLSLGPGQTLDFSPVSQGISSFYHVLFAPV